MAHCEEADGLSGPPGTVVLTELWALNSARMSSKSPFIVILFLGFDGVARCVVVTATRDTVVLTESLRSSSSKLASEAYRFELEFAFLSLWLLPFTFTGISQILAPFGTGRYPSSPTASRTANAMFGLSAMASLAMDPVFPLLGHLRAVCPSPPHSWHFLFSRGFNGWGHAK